MTGIALQTAHVPVCLHQRLASRLVEREGKQEYQFHFAQRPSELPVVWDGQIQILPWGTHYRKGNPLPVGGWVEEDRIPALFEGEIAEHVFIPANLGFHNGTWFLVDQGVRGIAVMQRTGLPIVYMLMRQATNYYRNMTQQSPLMPVFYGQVI